MELKYDKRGSGRTTKMLRDVLLNACKGKYCIVITASGSHSLNIIDNLTRLAAEIGIEFARTRDAKVYIGKEGGSVSFVPITSSEVNPNAMNVIGSHPDCETYVDHYAVMSRHQHVLDAFHRWD